MQSPLNLLLMHHRYWCHLANRLKNIPYALLLIYVINLTSTFAASKWSGLSFETVTR